MRQDMFLQHRSQHSPTRGGVSQFLHRKTAAANYDLFLDFLERGEKNMQLKCNDNDKHKATNIFKLWKLNMTMFFMLSALILFLIH